MLAPYSAGVRGFCVNKRHSGPQPCVPRAFGGDFHCYCVPVSSVIMAQKYRSLHSSCQAVCKSKQLAKWIADRSIRDVIQASELGGGGRGCF